MPKASIDPGAGTNPRSLSHAQITKESELQHQVSIPAKSLQKVERKLKSNLHAGLALHLDQHASAPSSWSRPEPMYDASIGYIPLYDDAEVRSPLKPKKTAHKGADPQIWHKQRPFLHNQPYSSRVISQLGRQVSHNQSIDSANTLTFTLIPSPWTAPTTFQNTTGLPHSLQLKFTSVQGAYSLVALSVMLEDRTADVLLPHLAVDARIRKQQFLSSMEPLQSRRVQSCAESILHGISEGGQLRAPSYLTVPVPAWTLYLNPIERLQEQSILSAADVEVQYMFIGVEHEQTVNLEWDGRNLEVVNLEAGRLGGRRTEWRLKPSHANGDLDEQGHLKGEFIRAAERLARLVDDAAWNRLPPLPKQVSGDAES